MPSHVGRWAYAEPGWAHIAALAPAVLQCAEEGDSIAFRIVTGAANEAVRAAVTVVERSRLKGHRFKLVLSGARLLPLWIFMLALMQDVSLQGYAGGNVVCIVHLEI